MVIRLALAFVLFFSTSPFSYAQVAQDKPKIVVSTSLIASIVQELAGDKLEVVTIVPSGMCPGHFDIRPEDVQALEEAQLLLEHGFTGELFVEDMIKLIKNPKLSRIALKVSGNWMVPDVYLQALEKIVTVLCQMFPEDAEIFKSRARNYKQQILIASRQIQQKAQRLNLKQIRVVCAKMQAEFLNWLGLDILATYGRPEDFTARALKDIIEKTKNENVKLVIDNLQSGARAGLALAQELNTAHLVLSNFPRDFSGRLSYIETLEENVAKIFQVVEE